MSGMDLIGFLRARIDEDEAAARAALRPRVYGAGPDGLLDAAEEAVDMALSEGCSEAAVAHLRRHLPARVLAEVAAKRAIVRLHTPAEPSWCPRCDSWPCSTLKALAAVYADHPDYDEAWRP